MSLVWSEVAEQHFNIPPMSRPSTRLSKSRFCYGLQCPRQLWWRVHEPEAPELQPDARLQAVFDRGHRVGEAARERFPRGVLIEGEPWEIREKVEQTRRALADGAEVIFEASFVADDVFVAVDALERGSDGFRLVEVKSTLDVKDAHLPDVAIQLHVLRRAGVDVRSAELMHLNRECQHPDLDKLFVRDDVTERAQKLLPAIPAQVDAMRRMLAGPLPVIDPGDRCTAPYACPFAARCTPEQPPDHVSHLHGLHSSRLAELLSRGISKVGDLPGEFELPATARRQVASLLAGNLVVEGDLAGALADVRAPVAFLDFETIAPAIPAWPGCRPYEPVAVQMSCHIVGSDGGIEHHQFLAQGAADPRPALAEAILSACDRAATVVAYNASFERRCIERLADAVPSLRTELRSVALRLVDLLPMVRDHVYHPEFDGSFSLKAVLPALVPGLGYADLAIADGGTASATLEALLLEESSFAPEEAREVRARLLAYCQRDTLALVRLVERLRALAAASRQPVENRP